MLVQQSEARDYDLGAAFPEAGPAELLQHAAAVRTWLKSLPLGRRPLVKVCATVRVYLLQTCALEVTRCVYLAPEDVLFITLPLGCCLFVKMRFLCCHAPPTTLCPWVRLYTHGSKDRGRVKK